MFIGGSLNRERNPKNARLQLTWLRAAAERRGINESNMRAYAVLFRPCYGSAPFYTGNHFYISFCDGMPGAGIQFIVLLEHAGRQHTKKLRNLV